ncbi:SNF2 family domain-containing protein [Diplocarpon rosae]|nr:SNF2 family domain-containing protein [Diplocarpon rosae]
MDLNSKPRIQSSRGYSDACNMGNSNAPTNTSRQPAFSSQSEWAPAALLNPRGGKPSTHAPASFNTPQYQNQNQAQVFEFDSPSGSSQMYSGYPAASFNEKSSRQNGTKSNGLTAYANANGSANGLGMGNMLERVHNVTDRSQVPQKRRRIEDDNHSNQRKAEFSGGSGMGNTLGAYMREKRQEGQRGTMSKGTGPVTIDDDEEVEIVGNSGDKEVCYGRVENASINTHQAPTPKPGTMSMMDGYWPQIKILLRRRDGEKTCIIHAIDGSRSIIGCLDVNTSIPLAPLMDSKFGIRTVARILTKPKREGDDLPGTVVSRRYPIDLNLFGPKKYAINVGRHLSQKQLWLRTPTFLESGIELHNPHVLQRHAQLPPRITSGHGSRQQGPARTTEEIRNDILGMFDSLERSENLPEMEPDARITTALLKHQKQGLYFMTNKEKARVFGSDEKGNSSLWRLNISASGSHSYYNVITGQEDNQSPPQVLGGILADMMGLGKTLQIISLVSQTLDNEAVEWAKLVPCASQDNRDLCPGRKGKNKALLPKLEQVPLVLNCKTTLLVSPLSTIANWEEQMKQHVKPGSLKYYIYHGANRIKDVKKLAEFDIVITTYGSIASEFSYRSKKKPGVYPLEEMNWFRIVLDEAHMIREQSTQQSKSICRLSANRRWAVTGTPVQNRLEDLGALMTFLRIKPFDEKGGFAQYIMAPFKNCDPEILPKLRLLVDSITLRRLKDRIDLPKRHDQLVKLEFNPEERQIYEVFAKNASDRVKVIVGSREKSLSGKSYVHILQSILRLRLICAHGRDLLNEEDLKVMSGLSKDSAIDLDGDEEEDRPALSAREAYEMYKLMSETNADLCLTCHRKIGPNDVESDDSKDEVIGHMTPCYHIICNACIANYKADLEGVAQGQSQVTCPICQQYIKLFYFPLRQGGLDDQEACKQKTGEARHGSKETSTYSGPHTKTKALIHDLLSSQQESQAMPEEPPIKSVIFSGWTAHLDLIQMALEENRITYTRLDGKMSRTARGAALDAFRDDPAITVILVSIMAGGLGLNLTTANKVYVMEPQYNPAAEAQAIDRVHRLGQKREVTTVRYIMSDSFEEKMLVLQEKKKKLAQLSMDSEGRGRIDKAEAARKRLEDLRSLFK